MRQVEFSPYGRYGPLVPVGNDVELASSILSVLKTPPQMNQLQSRAAVFSVDTAVDQYMEALLEAS